MLAACRTQQNSDVQPNFDLTCTDVEGFLDQLHEFHQAFQALIIGSATFGHPRRVRKNKNQINAIISNS
jgi:hypothetical protein